jgi:tRNA threonylcarbamoyladenosine biosynthesis protein TsaB
VKSLGSRSNFVSAKRTPLILSIETATRAGSVAVTRGERLLAARAGDAAISHSSLLLDYVNDALAEAGVSLGEIEIFAVAKGPGSFTGLRIGLATVKAFAATLSRSCVGVPTLYAVAHAAGPSERTLALLPAGRGEVYAQLLTVKPDGDVVPLDAPTHLTPHKLLLKVKTETTLTWAGEGAHIHFEAIKAQALAEGILSRDEPLNGNSAQGNGLQWTLAPAQSVLATSVAELVLLRVRSSAGLETPEQLRAIYVRPSDAELNERGLEER